jgi:uncharacterized protein
MGGALIISLHDVHPGSLEAVRVQVREFQAAGIDRFSLLVVPEFHHGAGTFGDAETLAFLEERLACGDELVVHGYYHDRQGLGAGNWFWTRWYTAGEAEFHDLTDGEARGRLERALSLWRGRGWPVGGFIAPGWLMPERQHGLLREAGFAYTTTLRTIVPLGGGSAVRAQSLCYSTRSGWRRSCSLAWNGWLHGRMRGGPVVRLGWHPGDRGDGRIRRQQVRLAEMALADGFRPVSYAEYVAG